MNWEKLDALVSRGSLQRCLKASPPEKLRTLSAAPGRSWRDLIRRGEYAVQCRENAFRLTDKSTGLSYEEDEVPLYVRIKHFATELSTDRVAILLEGGGARGAYQIGAWRGLQELGVLDHVGGLGGVSIGAVNALLFARGDYDYALRVWTDLSDREIRREKNGHVQEIYSHFKGYFLPIQQKDFFIIQSALQSELSRCIGGGRAIEICDRYMIYSTMSEVTPEWTVKQVYQPWRPLSGSEIVTAILASAALPVLYDPVIFREKTYVDGGVGAEPLPVKPLYDAGFRFFVVVHLSRRGDRAVRQLKAFPDCVAVHIIPEEDFEDDIKATVTLTPEATGVRIQQGYRDTIAQEGQLRALLQALS